MRKFLLLSSLALLPLLAGCAPKAELTIDATKLTACAPQIDFSKATQLPAVNEPGGQTSPQLLKKAPPPPQLNCLEENGRQLAYAVFALPPVEEAYQVQIKSIIKSKKVWRPEVRLFDASHHQVRTISPDTFDGKSDSAISFDLLESVRADHWLQLDVARQPQEHYLVLTTDPMSLGAEGEHLGLVPESQWVKRTKALDDCDGAGAMRKCTTRYVERTNLETVLVSGFVIYHFAESGSISAQMTYQKPQP